MKMEKKLLKMRNIDGDKDNFRWWIKEWESTPRSIFTLLTSLYVKNMAIWLW
jgi:hypothetical protein